MSSETFKIGGRVERIDTAGPHDFGSIERVDGDRVRVDWDNGPKTWEHGIVFGKHWRLVASDRANTCASCRHSARGRAIDLRPIRARGNPLRPSLRGGDYICARDGLTPAKVDSVTGFQALPSGPDCRDLNPDGACEHYQRGVKSSDVFGMAVAIFVAVALVAIWWL